MLTGPMFSGKTEALIKHVLAADKYMMAKAFKPTLDTRFKDSYIHSHGGSKIKSYPLDPEAMDLPLNVGLIAIDEAQFLSLDAIPRIMEALRRGQNVVLSGLDLDAFGRPFGPMPWLMAFANDVRKLSGTCAQCSLPSTRSQRLIKSDEAILVGGSDIYEPRCLACFEPAGSLSQ